MQAQPAKSAPYAELAKALSSKALQQVADFVVGDVVQLVRTLLSHRHNDVSDLQISNLVQLASVRPVTVSPAFSAFPEAGVHTNHSNYE